MQTVTVLYFVTITVMIVIHIIHSLLHMVCRCFNMSTTKAYLVYFQFIKQTALIVTVVVAKALRDVKLRRIIQRFGFHNISQSQS